MIERDPLPLMTNAERDAYTAWLSKLVSKRRGSIAEYLRRSAREISGRFA